MNNKVLTIAIPTYNRIPQLKRTLERLVPQLNDLCYLLILDNHSDVLVEKEVKELLSELDSSQYHVHHNRVNIGGDPNIHKCFEYCTTKWLWTLSDDDLIEADAIKTIFETIKEYPEALNINFYSPHLLHPVRHSSDLFYGKEGLIDSIDVFGASIFISSNIYNMSKISNYWESCRRTYSCASQWLIILFNISDEEFVVRSNRTIVINDYSTEKYTPVNLPIVNSFISILNIPLHVNLRKKLMRKILTIDDGWITFQNIVKLLIIEYFRLGKQLDIFFYLKRYYFNLYRYGKIKNFFIYYMTRIILGISPKLGFYLLRQALLMKSQGRKDIKNYVTNV